MVAEQGAIDFCKPVLFWIFGISIAHDEDDGVDDQQADDGMPKILPLEEIEEQRGEAITQGNTLEHTPDTKFGGDVGSIAIDEHVPGMQGNTDDEHQEGALQDLLDHSGFTGMTTHGDVDRYTHHEEEERKYKVTHRQTIPIDMSKWLIMIVVPAIVDQNHRSDGEAAQDIE